MNRLLKKFPILLVVLLLVSGMTVTAQSKTNGPTRPNWQLDPTYGSLELDSGFWPDPNVTSVTAGGGISLSSMGFSGYVAEAPDLDFYYDAGSAPLYIYVSEQDADTVLLVNDPSGDWHYSDDGAIGTRPGLYFSNPESGLYSIWIGTYGSSMVRADIAISEFSWESSSGASSGASPDWSREATYGTVNLSSGFTPDPNLTYMTAGGSVDLDSLGFPGYAALAPDLDLYYNAGSFNLYIYVTQADADTVLLVNDPSGNWLFSDDEIGRRPGIQIDDPESGLYNIWVGTYGSDMVSAEVAISEIGWSSQTQEADLSPNIMLDPTYGSVDLQGGFKAPYRLDMVAGGYARGYTVGYSGYMAEAPDLSLHFQSIGRPLYIYLDPDYGDTVLLINDPDGDWLYNDDANGLGLGSGIVINNPESGRYDIWAGTLGEDFVDATLVISEIRW